MYQLATPVKIPNLTRLRVRKVNDRPDDDEPNAVVEIELVSPGGIVYGPPDSRNFGTSPWSIRVTDDPLTCQGLNAKAAPVGFHDLIQTTIPAASGAYTAMFAAMNAATGGRVAKREAAETSLKATGVIGAALA